jgi:ABC-2 type transport system ATP-binding protein
MNKVLEINKLNKSYGTFSLQNISFDVPKGYITGFIGPNGAGKTTTIKAILNMISRQSGTIKIFGIDNDRNINVNNRIGVVMDSPFYVDDWTALDLERALIPFYEKWDKLKYSNLLNNFGIKSTIKIKELSRGMKVKLMIAAALSHDAELLILDEPTSGLDPVAREELCDILGEFISDENRSVLFSTHITMDLEKIADYIVFIINGSIVYSGSKENLIENYVLVKGGLEDLVANQNKFIIGLRKHGTGFEGMAKLSNVELLSKGFLVEPITLDEIIVFMNREGKNNE